MHSSKGYTLARTATGWNVIGHGKNENFRSKRQAKAWIAKSLSGIWN